jgi:transposase
LAEAANSLLFAWASTEEILHARAKGIRAISVELGVSRNTVRKYLRAQRRPKAKVRPSRSSKLDSFRDYLKERIRQAHPQWIPASVLQRKITELGYGVKGAILRA